jgi:hypothetical protein
MTYFVETFDPNNKRDVGRWLKEDFDSHDRWGWAMGWLFDIAAELYQRPNTYPPEGLQYQPGIFGPEVSEDNAEGDCQLVENNPLEYIHNGFKNPTRFRKASQ